METTRQASAYVRDNEGNEIAIRLYQDKQLKPLSEYEQIEAIILALQFSDCNTWLKDTLNSALKRPTAESLQDLELLVVIFKARLEHIKLQHTLAACKLIDIDD